jgi:hypothetical protein
MINVYLISSEINGKKLYKIGYTRRSIEERINEFRTGNASEFEIIDSFRSKWGTKIESSLHRYHIGKIVNGEWFNLSELDISEFKNICQKMHNNFELMIGSNTYVMDGKSKEYLKYK